MDPATFILLSPAIIGFVAGLIGAAVSGWINRKNTLDTLASNEQREHLNWLRNQRQEAYVEFLGAAEAIMAMTQSDLQVKMEAPPLDELRVLMGRLRLVGSSAAFKESGQIDQAVKMAVISRQAHDRANFAEALDEDARSHSMIDLFSNSDKYAVHVSRFVDIVRAEVGAGFEVRQYGFEGVRQLPEVDH